MVSAFTNGPAKVEAKKNGKFELFGGNVHGEFSELVSCICFAMYIFFHLLVRFLVT